jgi:hypothetical protein
MIFGTLDIPISNLPFQETMEKEYAALAQRQELTLNIIRTNALELLNFERLNHLFGRLNERGYWDGIGYMLCHIGQAAPLSIGRFGRLLAASGAISAINPRKYPCSEWIGRGDGPGIGWADISVEWHGENPRHEKAFFLKDFLDANGSKLRVCFESESRWSRDLFNCSRCEKCLLAIAMLASAGIDPTRFGFSMDRSTFDRTRRVVSEASAIQIAIHCKPFQRAIPDVIGPDIYGARGFIEWFKTLDLDSMERSYRSLRSNLYYRLPYCVARTYAWYRTGADRLLLSARLWQRAGGDGTKDEEED